MLYGISLIYRETEFHAGDQHSFIQIDAMDFKTMVSKQFKPFATATAQVGSQTPTMNPQQGLDEGEVDFEALLDQIA